MTDINETAPVETAGTELPPVAPAGNAPAPVEGQNAPNAAHNKETFLKQVRKFGTMEGQGAAARPAFAAQLVEAAHMGAIKPDDADIIFDAFAAGQAAAKGIGYVKQGSKPQQVSKVRTFIKAGCLVNVDARRVLMSVGAEVIAARGNNGDKPLAKSPYDCMLSAMRMQLDTPDVELTQEQIKSCVNPNPRDEKEEVDKLGNVYDAMNRIYTDEKHPPTGDTKALLEGLMTEVNDRIMQMGGTKKMREAQEKAKRAAEKIETDKKKAAEKAEKLKKEAAEAEAAAQALAAGSVPTTGQVAAAPASE